MEPATGLTVEGTSVTSTAPACWAMAKATESRDCPSATCMVTGSIHVLSELRYQATSPVLMTTSASALRSSTTMLRESGNCFSKVTLPTQGFLRRFLTTASSSRLSSVEPSGSPASFSTFSALTCSVPWALT